MYLHPYVSVCIYIHTYEPHNFLHLMLSDNPRPLPSPTATDHIAREENQQHRRDPCAALHFRRLRGHPPEEEV